MLVPCVHNSKAKWRKARDRLLEINSSGAGRGQALVAAIAEQDDTFALPIYMEQLFNAFGIDSEDHSDNALILRPSEKKCSMPVSHSATMKL